MNFFVAMKNPPTITHQQKKVHVVKGKPVFYEPDELKAARKLLRDSLIPYVPDVPFEGGVRLVVKWCFPRGEHKDGEYRITKPDTDNLQKLLKDVMTDLHFWIDDALVCSEICEKFWAEVSGIFVSIEDV